MSVQELIRYLKRFPEDAELSTMIVNLSKREVHPVIGCAVVSDSEVPALFIETGEPVNLEEIGGTT